MRLEPLNIYIDAHANEVKLSESNPNEYLFAIDFSICIIWASYLPKSVALEYIVDRFLKKLIPRANA
jgi:hypothetical protein